VFHNGRVISAYKNHPPLAVGENKRMDANDNKGIQEIKNDLRSIFFARKIIFDFLNIHIFISPLHSFPLTALDDLYTADLSW
jgi:hypothetical protein